MGCFDDEGEWMCGANFVVGQHQGDQCGVWAQGGAQLGKIDISLGINSEPGDLKTVHTFQET